MPIETTDITNDALTGIFDVIMKSANTHLLVQLDKGRIVGADFATVYLGTIQTAMQQSMQYLSIKEDFTIKEEQSTQDLALKQSQQELVDQQTLTQIETTKLSKQKFITEYANTNQDDIKTAPNVADVAGGIAAQQLAKTLAEAALLAQKHITEFAQTRSNTTTEYGTNADLSNPLKAGLVGSQTKLYTHQTNGFKFKAAQDSIKSLTDLFTVIISSSSPDGIPETGDTGTKRRMLDMVIETYNEAVKDDPSFSTLTPEFSTGDYEGSNT